MECSCILSVFMCCNIPNKTKHVMHFWYMTCFYTMKENYFLPGTTKDTTGELLGERQGNTVKPEIGSS